MSSEQSLGGLSLAHLAIGMGIFTILMVWDIFEFGKGFCAIGIKKERFSVVQSK